MLDILIFKTVYHKLYSIIAKVKSEGAKIMKKIDLATKIGQLLQTHGLMLTTAESCTGGLVAAAITEIPGSSQWFDRGFVTYSNRAKQEMLGVQANVLEKYGAVSEPVAIAMAEGGLVHSSATVSVAITGIAGPAGGTLEKPVGSVWFAWKLNNFPVKTSLQLFQGDRQKIRSLATDYCMAELVKYIVKSKL